MQLLLHKSMPTHQANEALILFVHFAIQPRCLLFLIEDSLPFLKG